MFEDHKPVRSSPIVDLCKRIKDRLASGLNMHAFNAFPDADNNLMLFLMQTIRVALVEVLVMDHAIFLNCSII